MNPQLAFLAGLYAGYFDAWCAAVGWKLLVQSIEGSEPVPEQRWEGEGGALQ